MPLPEPPPTGHLPFEPPADFAPDLAPFWELWRAEKFWACHEALETVWLAESDSKRKLGLQGLIHGAVAVFQHRRGNAWGAARQLKRAQVKLGTMRPAFENVDVDAFLAGVEREIAASLQALSSEQLGELEKLEIELRARLS